MISAWFRSKRCCNAELAVHDHVVQGHCRSLAWSLQAKLSCTIRLQHLPVVCMVLVLKAVSIPSVRSCARLTCVKQQQRSRTSNFCTQHGCRNSVEDSVQATQVRFIDLAGTAVPQNGLKCAPVPLLRQKLLADVRDSTVRQICQSLLAVASS